MFRLVIWISPGTTNTTISTIIVLLHSMQVAPAVELLMNKYTVSLIKDFNSSTLTVFKELVKKEILILRDPSTAMSRFKSIPQEIASYITENEKLTRYSNEQLKAKWEGRRAEASVNANLASTVLPTMPAAAANEPKVADNRPLPEGETPPKKSRNQSSVALGLFKPAATLATNGNKHSLEPTAEVKSSKAPRTEAAVSQVPVIDKDATLPAELSSPGNVMPGQPRLGM